MQTLDVPNKSSSRIVAQEFSTLSSWVEISKSALEHNLSQYSHVISPAFLAPVLKSNAYGHGIENIAQICSEHPSVRYICVASLKEALTLRALGIKKPLLVLSIIDGNLEDILLHDIDVVIYQKSFIKELNHIASLLKKNAYVHIKLDTGLSRLGFTEFEIQDLLKDIADFSYLTLRGVFTHFSDSESEDQSFTMIQLQRFDKLANKLQSLTKNELLKHTACSAASTANKSTHHDLVRAGIGIYGLWPSHENKKKTLSSYPFFSLKPVLTWKTRIIHIKNIPEGSYVGYDRTFRANKPLTVATLPIGYWDGYDRHLSNKGKVLINNYCVPIIGRIAMNLTMIDITNLPVNTHNEVIVLGDYQGVTADDLAHSCDTINYEIVTRINPLLPRFIVS